VAVVIRTSDKKNTYIDSVSLMALSSRANAIDGIEQAFVGMGTPMNKEVLANLELLTPELEQASIGDLMIVIQASTADDLEAVSEQHERLFQQKGGRPVEQGLTYRTLASAAREVPGSN
jgi:deferrochelatase/peroxidase EfeB